ncbi:hypothetical protein ACFE04_016271 [Oxalis oulophora]
MDGHVAVEEPAEHTKQSLRSEFDRNAGTNFLDNVMAETVKSLWLQVRREWGTEEFTSRKIFDRSKYFGRKTTDNSPLKRVELWRVNAPILFLRKIQPCLVAFPFVRKMVETSEVEKTISKLLIFAPSYSSLLRGLGVSKVSGTNLSHLGYTIQRGCQRHISGSHWHFNLFSFDQYPNDDMAQIFLEDAASSASFAEAKISFSIHSLITHLHFCFRTSSSSSDEEEDDFRLELSALGWLSSPDFWNQRSFLRFSASYLVFFVKFEFVGTVSFMHEVLKIIIQSGHPNCVTTEYSLAGTFKKTNHSLSLKMDFSALKNENLAQN